MTSLVKLCRRTFPVLFAAAISMASPARAQDPVEAPAPCPCPPEDEAPPPVPLWTAKVGLSYVATTGNSETTTFGSDVDVARRPTPWGVEIFANYDRAENGDAVQSERTFGGARVKRALGERWELFGEATGEKDEFAGFDLRTVFAAGGTYHALTGPRHVLDTDLGVTWTDEDRIEPAEDVSFVGALVGLDYAWAITERSTFDQRLTWFPSFETSSDWRLESVTSLEASLTERLALRLGYEVRFQNEPIDDLEDTDTTTRMSLVVNL